MAYIQLEEPYSALSHRRETVEIELLSDSEIIDELYEEKSDIQLVSLDASPPGVGDHPNGTAPYSSRNGKNILLAALLLLGGIFTVLFSQWLNYEKIAGKYFYASAWFNC